MVPASVASSGIADEQPNLVAGAQRGGHRVGPDEPGAADDNDPHGGHRGRFGLLMRR
jgi:hypothetical protein